MALTIAQANLDTDRDVLIDTVRRLLTPRSNDARFDWLYNNSPHGAARGWLAIDETRDTIIGIAAAFPRRFYVDGSDVCFWVLGDFCLDSEYRSLGPALQLQRACLEVVEENHRTVCYDFPSAAMVAVYRRLGFSMTGQMLRLAMPLRVDRRVKEWVRSRAVQRVLSSVGNAVLKVGVPKAPVGDALEVSVQSGPCGEFTALTEAQGGNVRIFLRRSAEYLNWRYVDNPLASYEIVTARRDGKLKGYAVWTEAEQDASVVDLFGEDDPVIVKALLAGVVGRLTDRCVTTLNLWLSDSHPWLSLCQKMGFRARDSVPMVCVPGSILGNAGNMQRAKLFLMQGDRDS
jgi:GNAT superfamily N-acetyltransferase